MIHRPTETPEKAEVAVVASHTALDRIFAAEQWAEVAEKVNGVEGVVYGEKADTKSIAEAFGKCGAVKVSAPKTELGYVIHPDVATLF